MTPPEQVTERALADAKLFVEEFGEPIDTAATDWDATAWGEAVRALGLSNEQGVELWPHYLGVLEAETDRLCAAPPRGARPRYQENRPPSPTGQRRNGEDFYNGEFQADHV